MTTKKQHLQSLLSDFYQKPIAQVSSELFFSLIAVIVFAVFAIRPTLLTISRLIKEVRDKEVLHQALVGKIASLSSAQAALSAQQEQFALLDEALPNQARVVEAITMIEKLASEQHLLITSISTPEVPEQTPFSQETAASLSVASLPISLTLQAPYPAVRQFLDQLQTIRRVISIDSVVFDLSDNQGRQQLQATITLSLPYITQESTLAKEK